MKMLKYLIVGVMLCSTTLVYSQLFGREKEDTEKDVKSSFSALFSKNKTDQKQENQESVGGKIENRTFSYRGFGLNTDVDIDVLLSDTMPPQGFKRYITEMRYYEQGEDIRMVDNANLNVSLMFDEDTRRLITIEVSDIEDVSVVQQLQQMVRTQMGEPTKGYELMKNYDGDKNTIWTDYSTYEFIYCYDIGAYSYDFRITQYGAKMKNKKVIHPYDFVASVSKRAEKSLSVEEITAAERKQEKKEQGKKFSKEEEDAKFYPEEGTKVKDGYMIEQKLLRKW